MQPTAMQDRLLLTVNETAHLLSHSRNFIYQLIRERQLETIRTGGRQRVLASSLQAYIEGRRDPERAAR